MKGLSRYIDFNLDNSSTLFYIALILLISSHFIHYVGPDLEYFMFFKTLFILAYLVFIANDIFTKGQVHVANLVGKSIIIVMVLVSIYSDVKQLKNTRSSYKWD